VNVAGYPALNTIRRNGNFFKEIYPDVWLMDNHKWAFFIWEDYRYKNPGMLPPTLVHIDYHWDGINDFQSLAEINDLINVASSKEMRKLVAQDSLVRLDSFIAPSIIRRIIEEVHFHCLQSDSDEGIDNDLLRRYRAKQFSHSNIDSLIQSAAGKSVIFDIDLDIFNRSGQWSRGELWAEDDILSFLDKCSILIANSSLVTIAMSFDYSGASRDTKYLVQLAVPRIIKHFHNRSKRYEL